MMPLILLVTLAGFVFLFSRRQHIFEKRQIQPRVVVKGHTYSDSVDDESIKPKRVEEVRRVCFLGTGGGGQEGDIAALTALVLADRNSGVQFDIVDRDMRRIAAWNADHAPVSEPGVDRLLFDDAVEQKEGEFLYNQELHRKRRLANVVFSTDVAGCVAGADMVFLCDDVDMNTIRTIAQVSTGHKIIVHKGRASTKAITKAIRKNLDKAPTASFDVLANPDFLAPGNIIHDLLHPSRVVIGNLSDKHSLEAAALLKNLYAWVPGERVLTTDVWSAELGRIATNALLAQQNATIHALSAICSRTDASGPQVSQIVAMDPRLAMHAVNGGVDEDGLRKDIDCLVYLAQELGLCEVAEYWRCVMRVNDTMNHRVAHRMALRHPERAGGVGMLGFSCTEGTSSSVGFVRTLVQRGAPVHIYDPYMGRDEILATLGFKTGVEVMDDVERTVSGCSAVVLHTDRGLGSEIDWEAVAGSMQSPCFFLDPFHVMGRMEQFGFQMDGHDSRQGISM